MIGTSIRWVFLLALGLAILGAIQCPTADTPPSPKRSGSPLRSIGKAISRRLSRIRSGSSSRSDSSSGSDTDCERSGSDRETMPASGDHSGRGPGRLPRSRSPSPGGGSSRRSAASSSGTGSSSATSTSRKMHAGLSFSDIPLVCRGINTRGTAQVINNTRVATFQTIIQELRDTAVNDRCYRNMGRGFQPGSEKCQQMYGEFKKIEPQYRGECADAVSANCLWWPASDGTPEQKKCTFFVQTGQRSSIRMDGFYISLSDCIESIKHQIFMDHQMADMGIRPPESPPKPLLPPGYSPDQ